MEWSGYAWVVDGDRTHVSALYSPWRLRHRTAGSHHGIGLTFAQAISGFSLTIAGPRCTL
jgi:hypothetical protein